MGHPVHTPSLTSPKGLGQCHPPHPSRAPHVSLGPSHCLLSEHIHSLLVGLPASSLVSLDDSSWAPFRSALPRPCFRAFLMKLRLHGRIPGVLTGHPISFLTPFCVPAQLTMALDFPVSALFALLHELLSFPLVLPHCWGQHKPLSMTQFKLCCPSEFPWWLSGLTAQLVSMRARVRSLAQQVREPALL